MSKWITVLLLCFLFDSHCQTYLPFNIDGKWGAITADGNLAIPPGFSKIGDFKNGIAIAKFNGAYGLIDTLGQTIVPFEYREIFPLKSESQISLWLARGKYGFQVINALNLRLSKRHFNTIRMFGHNYIGERESGIFLGVLGDTTQLSDSYDNIKEVGQAFLCSNINSKEVLNEELTPIVTGEVTDVRSLSNSLVVTFPNKRSLYKIDGELILENIEDEKSANNRIIGFDLSKGKPFVWNEVTGGLNYLNSEIYLGQYSEYMILKNAEEQIIFVGPDGKRKIFEGYTLFDIKYGFLLLGKDLQSFDVYNSDLEKLISNTDLIESQGDFYLFRRDGKYGLLDQNEILLEAKYNFFDITETEIKAHPDKGLLHISLENNVPGERNFFPNYISLKSYGTISSTRLSNQALNGFNSRSFSSGLWNIDTIQFDDSDRFKLMWGLKKDTFLTPERYTTKRELNDRVSLAYNYRRSRNTRIIGDSPSNSMFDLVNHEKGYKINKKRYYNFNRLYSGKDVFVVKNRDNILILDSNLMTLHSDVAYINTRGSGSLYPFCEKTNDVRFQSDEDADANSIPIGDWLDFLGTTLMFPNINMYTAYRNVSFVDAKWGYINDSASIKVNALYDYVFPLRAGIGVVKLDGKYGAIVPNKEIIPTVYDRLTVFRLDSDAYVRAVKFPSSSIIYIDSLGNPKKAGYRAMMSTWKNDNTRLITVKSGELYGLVNRDGEIVIPIQLTMPPIVTRDYVIGRSPKCGVYDLKGNILVDHNYRRIEDYNNGLVVFRERNKYGIGDAEGNTIISANFDDIELGESSIYCVRSGHSLTYDYNGELISNENWDYSYYDEEGDNWIYRRGGRTVVEYNGEIFRYNDLNRSIRFMGDYLLVEHNRGEFNLHKINEELTPIFSTHFNKIEEFNDSIFQVFDRSRFGLRNIKDEQIIPVRYRGLVEIFEDTIAGIYSGLLRVFDLSGEVLFEREAELVVKSENNCFLVKGKNGATFYDKNFQNKFYRTYEDASVFKVGFASISEDGMWTLINSEGDEMFEPCYGHVVPLGFNIFYAKNRYQTGVFNDRGEEVLAVKYDEITKVDEKLLRVIDDGNVGYYHIDGYWIVQPGEIPLAFQSSE